MSSCTGQTGQAKLDFSGNLCGAAFAILAIFTIVLLLLINTFIIIIITAGIAVLLTIITYFSTPILTKIFGDGSLEVLKLSKHTKKIVNLFFFNLYQGEDLDLADYSAPANLKVRHTSFPIQCFILFIFISVERHGDL